MKDLTEILKEVVDKINLELNVIDIQGNKIFLCNTLHLAVEDIIEDGNSNKYQITEMTVNEFIVVIPVDGAPDPFNSSIVVCPPPVFLFGTPASTNNEYLALDADSAEKLPLIWLLENYEETFFGRESSIERRSAFRIFFLDETDEEEWLNKEHHQLVIQPMMNLCEAFIDAINADRTFKTFEQVTKIPRVRFGVYRTNQGNERKIIDENISGVELAASFEKFKTYNCKC
jgi:hypothetical protein